MRSPSELTTHEVLVNARNRLAQGHLVKGGGMCDHKGGFCAIGSLFGGGGTFIGRAGDDPLRLAALALQDALGAPRPGEGGSGWEIVEFNNAPETTKADVLGLLDKAIAQTAPEPDVSFVAEGEAVPA